VGLYGQLFTLIISTFEPFDPQLTNLVGKPSGSGHELNGWTPAPNTRRDHCGDMSSKGRNPLGELVGNSSFNPGFQLVSN